MRHGTRRYQANQTSNEVIASLRYRIAGNLGIAPDRIRYVKGRFPGQFRETDMWRWEIYYSDQWRELPWHFDGPLGVDRELVRKWYG